MLSYRTPLNGFSGNMAAGCASSLLSLDSLAACVRRTLQMVKIIAAT
jgi:hypothetical protein